MGLANYLRSMSDAETENHYYCLIRFWTSVYWYYPLHQYKQVLSQNITLLAEAYRKRL